MRIGTLFSGIGSPEQGAKRVYDDLDLVFACEWDKYARESFKANYKIEDNHFHKDIEDMDGKQYKGKVDIIIGGSPCQDFSLAGLRKGIDGNKGVLIYEYIRIIQEVNPPIFIYENVKGMLSDKNGRTIKEFVQVFREMGYHCHYEVLNTKDYGVPQNRERIFLVGFKDVEHYYNFSFAPKIKLEKRPIDLIDTSVESHYIDKTFTITGNSSVIAKIDGVNYEQQARVYNPYKYSPTLLTSTIPHFLIGDKIRKLTAKECLLFNDFIDFNIVLEDVHIYKQAGNSISVNMMEMIFNQIEKARHQTTKTDRLF